MSAENNGGSNASKLCPLWHNLEIDVFRMLFYVVVAHRRWFSFFSFFFSFRWLMHSLVPSLITAIDWCSLRASSVVVVAMNEVFSVRHGLFNSDNCSVGLETILVCVCVTSIAILPLVWLFELFDLWLRAWRTSFAREFDFICCCCVPPFDRRYGEWSVTLV